MRIQHSQEDYLEAILILAEKNGAVRSVDVAEHLGFSKASVSRAVTGLAQAGLVHMDESKFLHLTGAGREKAARVYEKHQFFKKMLLEAGVGDATAAEDACRIEHAISDEAFTAIKQAYARK